MRASELRGLWWADVDLDGRKLEVRRRADRYHVIGMPKSDAGQRTVPLPPLVVNTLREWQLACPRPATGETDENGKPIREPARPEHLVFPNGEGKIEWHSNIIARGLLPTQMAAGVTVPAMGKDRRPLLDKDGEPVMRAKYTGLHALRHFFASWCINRVQDGGLRVRAPVPQQGR